MIKRKMMVVAGGPVVRALCFYCREHGFDSRLRSMQCSEAKKKKKKKNGSGDKSCIYTCSVAGTVLSISYILIFLTLIRAL